MSIRTRAIRAPLIALFIALAAAVAAITAPALRPAPRSGPRAVAHVARAADAADAARAPVTVSLDAGTVEWRTAPYETVTASWYAGAARRFSSTGFADSTGRVIIGELDNLRPGGLFMDGVDRLVLSFGQSGGPTFDVPLPVLDAEVDAPGDSVDLRAAAGAALAVRIRRTVDGDVLALGQLPVFNPQSTGDGPFAGQRPPDALGPPLWSGDALVDTAGRARLALGGALDVRPGDVAEVVRTVGADTFVLRRTAFQLRIAAGSDFPLAVGRPGEAVALTIRDGAGREKACSTVVDARGGAAWSCATIGAGDRITVTHTGRLLPAARASTTVPRLGFRPAGGGAPATLTGPPGGRLRFVEVSALGAVSGDDVILDGRGEAALPAGRPAPGGHYVVGWTGVDGSIVVGGPTGFVPQVRLMLGEPWVRGDWPAAPVTVTIAGPDGARLGRWSKPAWRGASAYVALYGRNEDQTLADLHRLSPGDRVEVAIGADEPLVWTLPDLDLLFDTDTGRLSGRLPAGTDGTLSILEPFDGDADPFRSPPDVTNGAYIHRATLPLPTDADGRFSLDLADVRGPDGRPVPTHRLVQGVVTAVRADGAAVAAVFGGPWLDVNLYDPTIDGFGPAGQAVTLEVAGRSGGVEAIGRAEPSDAFTVDQPYWRSLVEDRFGVAAPLRAGDLVTVTVGASRATLRVPSLEGYVDLEAQRARGRTAPGTPLRVATYGDGIGALWQLTTAGADGSFDVALAAAAALRVGDIGGLQARFGSHSLGAALVVPAVVIDLSAGRIWGRGPAGASVQVELRRDGRTVAAGRRIVDEWLGYDVDPLDAAGAHVPPAAGDVIVQRTDGLPTLTVTVPAFSAAWDRAAGRIVGQAPAGSVVERRPSPGYVEPDPTWQIGALDVAASGAFSGQARHPGGRVTGLTQILSARAPSGVEALRWVVAPVLNVPLGGESVCGQAMPWAIVRAEATLRDGRTARGQARANAIGRFRVPLGGGDARPVVLAAGDVVRATADGATLESVAPVLTLAVDRGRGTAGGRAPAGAKVSIEGPGGSCDSAFDASRFGVFDTIPVFSATTTADAAGAYAARLPEPYYRYASSRPRAYEAAIRDAAGHRVFRISRALRLTALIDTPLVLGDADAGRNVDVTLTRPGGVTAHGAAIADATGRFTATLTAEGGAAPRVQAGDRIDAVAGDESRGLTVPALAVDWYPERGIVGRTDGGATVDARFVLLRGHLVQNETDVTFTLSADAAGRFASPLARARGIWTLDDVRRVEVWRTLDGDDRAMVAFDTGRAPAPTPTAGPTPSATATSTSSGAGRLWLPWTGRGGRLP